MSKGILISMSFCLLFFASVMAQDNADHESVKTRIDTYVSNSVKNGYSASILVAKDGEIIVSKGYGWADRKGKIPNKSQTVFNIGSVTKQFTAAAILKLMENNMLKVSDKLSHYFPQVPADKQNITIHQLLTHTSGISPQMGGFRYHEASKEQFLKECFAAELMYLPGSKHTYANANYILLAAIIEKVSGQDYETFLKETFWKPLHMDHTGYKSINFNSEQLAHGYYFQYTDGFWEDWGTTQEYLPYNDNHWYSIGKGDVYSTVEDLYTWHLALENNQVLKAETKQLMETAHVAENEGNTSFYGYGWAIFNTSNNTKIVTHNGSNGIFFADFLRYAKDDLVVIVLSNSILNQQSENMGWEIASMVNDENYEPTTIPKNTYELVFDFMNVNIAGNVNELNPFMEDKTGMPISDRAILNRIGFNQVSKSKDADWGIALLQLNTSLFPDDGNLWDSVGEAYFILGDTENSIVSFNKAIALGADKNCYWCKNSEKRLEELTKK
ncbi:serine hydrolase domain-containing protein [Flagellimonas zhangzhouensis]|uniref:CubicO group peptidase, beta-lactamase class C family n=1 Tax=Flagellimonas zhangzhouensis TaxID=1073328 RepID=A0A1H2VYG2_9FLAO|nr:serine hydrolase domain-containing protein [Allomuricauda zhangzhouensis]SDQ04831.1 CubicO group peptidase, beta-lactamase class C family [Allomuricauda zhangzhouensis]SDW73398.1 CubicO group peptidase, beta-lactamase class C family [Allomuricauda zhangzhouensis]